MGKLLRQVTARQNISRRVYQPACRHSTQLRYFMTSRGRDDDFLMIGIGVARLF